MSRFKLWLLGRLMVWFAKRENMSEEEIDSGLTVCSVDELRSTIAHLENYEALNRINRSFRKKSSK